MEINDVESMTNGEIALTKPIIEEIANKWSVLILNVLCSEPTRFNELKRRLGSVTHKALTEALRRLERNGLLSRRVLASSPVAVEYSLTPLGRSLQEPFSAIYLWATRHQGEIERAQKGYDRAAKRVEHVEK